MRAPAHSLPGHPRLRDARDLELGVSTSAFQSEGGLDLERGPRTHWFDAQRRGEVEPIGAGVGLWRRFDEAAARCGALGLRRFRFTLEWARLRPDGPSLDRRALRGYASRIIALRRNGMEPIVTLHHFTHPRWMGGDLWLREDAPTRFAAHAAEVIEGLDDALESLGSPCVDRVLTLNEPNMLAVATYVAGVFPRGARALAEGSPLGVVRAWRALDAMLAGHCLAFEALAAGRARRGRPPADVSLNLNLLDLHGLGAGIFDLLRSVEAGVSPRDLDRWLASRRASWHGSLFGDERESPRARFAASLDAAVVGLLPLSRLSRTTQALRRAARAPLDHLAIDLYDPYSAQQLRPASLVDALLSANPDALARAVREGVRLADPWEWAPAPEALPRMIRAMGEGMRVLPVDVIECGMCLRREEGEGCAEPRADGLTREGFLRVMLRSAIETRVVHGLPLRAWLYWTLVDNYELGRWAPRFGLWSAADDDGSTTTRRWGACDAAGEDASALLGMVSRALASDPVDAAALTLALGDGL